MALQDMIERVAWDVREHCRRRGYTEGPWLNPMTPQDPVAALAMARMLSQRGFERYLAVAPEGHVYGYFFERLGCEVVEVHVDYPPTQARITDDLSDLRDSSVLVIEDDVISGISLGLVIDVLSANPPRSLSLYLGRSKEAQLPERIPACIQEVFFAEDCLHDRPRARLEAEFEEFFGNG